MPRTEMALSLQLIYDSGALIAAERNDRRMWALHARALQRGVQPVVPSGCLVEVWNGDRQINLTRLLDGCEVEALAVREAKQAGTMRRGLGSVSAVDASVAESAVRRGAAVVTSDRGDIELLTKSSRRKVSIIDV